MKSMSKVVSNRRSGDVKETSINSAPSIVAAEGKVAIRTYIVDFFNIFSDFREIKYKQSNVDFHSVKHNNKAQDTKDFFDLFFTKYIEYVQIDTSSRFIFVMKKLYGYEHILEEIVSKYQMFDIKLMIIEDRYNNGLLDKNKDDFLCQYIFQSMKNVEHIDCRLISNDKYRDRQEYVRLFTSDMSIKVIKWDKKQKKLSASTVCFEVNKHVGDAIICQKYNRCTIPKHKLPKIL